MRNAFLHLLIIFLLLAGLVFFRAAGWLSPALDYGRLGAAFLQKPLMKVFGGMENFFGFVGRMTDLSRQNSILSLQVRQLEGELAGLQSAAGENRVLREALGLRTRSKTALIPAEVIAASAQGASQKLTLDRGRAAGIKAGDAVVDAGGAMAGVVSDVLENTSQMALITSGEVVVNVRTSNGSATGVVRGEHGLGLLFDLIAQNEKVESDARVITSGLGGQFPPNLLVGTIGDLRGTGSDLFQKASVIPAANLRDLRIIFVVKNK